MNPLKERILYHFKEEIANLKTDIAMNDIADEKLKTLVVNVLELATQAHELFVYATLSKSVL